ncbi:hypothetical protein [Nocardia farcinica]|uniref:hypothetical protein n=1 Tax=Nocardia farcinica TaxID=37329 RepID=UPI0024565556|nr:hypothetical protein [Nocardia farcinica]
MQVTIEGVVSTDVCRRGEQHTVEWTEHLRRLAGRGYVKVIEWHHPEVEPAADGPVTDAPVAAKLPKRSRRRKAADTSDDGDTDSAAED